MRAPSEKKRELVKHINRLGVAHMIMGVIGVAIGFASFGVDRCFVFSDELRTGDEDPSNEEVREVGDKVRNYQLLRHIMMGLDIAAVFSALWLINVGFQPFVCFTSDEVPFRVTWIRLKIRFMVLNILTASIFAPIIMGSATANYIIRGSKQRDLMALTSVSILYAVLEFFFSIVSAAFSCCSRWRFDDDNDRCRCRDVCDCTLREGEKCSRSEDRDNCSRYQDVPPQYHEATKLSVYKV